MSDHFDPDDHHAARRLRALGSEPIEPHVAGGHLTAMASTTARRKRFGALAVALAAMTGFAVGSTGLAAAGALPGPGQDAAAMVLAQVGVDVPRTHGHCISELAQSISDDDPAKGERISAAARGETDECPKPGRRGRPNFAARPHEGDPCRGAPAWAGRGRPTDDEKAAHQAGRQSCGGDSVERSDAGPGTDTGGRPDGDADGCSGPPSWAGRGQPSEAEKRERHTIRESCRQAPDEQPGEPDPGEDPRQGLPGD